MWEVLPTLGRGATDEHLPSADDTDAHKADYQECQAHATDCFPGGASDPPAGQRQQNDEPQQMQRCQRLQRRQSAPLTAQGVAKVAGDVGHAQACQRRAQPNQKSQIQPQWSRHMCPFALRPGLVGHTTFHFDDTISLSG